MLWGKRVALQSVQPVNQMFSTGPVKTHVNDGDRNGASTLFCGLDPEPVVFTHNPLPGDTLSFPRCGRRN